MYCVNCGNKIEDGEKFCGKCGQPANYNKEENNTNVNNIQKKHIKIKFSNLIFIIGITTLVFVMVIIIAVSKNNSLVGKTTNMNTSLQDSNVTNKTLDIIDKEKQVLKINILDLSNELIKIKDEEETANREPWKSEYELISKVVQDINGNNVKAYGLISKLGKYNQYYKSPFQFVADNDGNVFRIFVLHEYKTDYGSSSLSSSDNLYKWLYKALNNLGASELVDAIEKLKKEQVENGSKYVPDENGKIYIELNGITITVIDAGKNQYGVSAGKYLGFCVR